VPEFVIGLRLLHGTTPRDHEAWRELATAMADARLTDPDENGVFEAAVESRDEESALLHVHNAIAAAGADDHIGLAEHS
jgi:hypothetical protein